MKKYDFNVEVNRKGTDSLKWDSMDFYYKKDDLIPMWVADMDLRCSDEIIEALTNRAQHGIYGYSVKHDDYYQAIMGWYSRRHQTELSKEWIIYIPNVITALRIAISQFSEPQDKIAMIGPVYGPFKGAIECLGRTVSYCSLKNDNGKYSIDYEQLDKTLDGCKVLLFCSPHNPVGRVWTKDELVEVAKLCKKHNVLLVSDEIHCDLVQKPNKFVPFMKLDEYKDNIITLISVSKTFNCAGLMGATAIISNPEIKAKFMKPIIDFNLYMTNTFTITGVKAAYNHGDDWVDQVIEYIGENYRYISGFLKENIPEITHSDMQGSYLMWLDCSTLAKDDETMDEIMETYCGIAGEPGGQFGDEGKGFYRLNLATRKEVIVKTMNNMLEGITKYKQDNGL